jgi:hypothetical protein
MEMFNLRNLNQVECKDMYHVETSNRFAALEDSAWEKIRGKIKFQA